MIIGFILIVFTQTPALASSDLGNHCRDSSDGSNKCDKSIKLGLLDIVDFSAAIKMTKASYYGGIFQNRKTASGNCFDKFDPTVAVNESHRGELGQLKIFEYNGHRVLGLVTDTGRMSSKENGRDFDLSENLISLLSKSYKDIGVLRNGLRHKTISTLKKVFGDEYGDKPKNIREEQVINCLREINNEWSEQYSKIPRYFNDLNMVPLNERRGYKLSGKMNGHTTATLKPGAYSTDKKNKIGSVKINSKPSAQQPKQKDRHVSVPRKASLPTVKAKQKESNSGAPDLAEIMGWYISDGQK